MRIRKPRTPRQVMQGLQHLTLASRVTQFLDSDTATEPPSEPPGPPPSPPSEPPATAATDSPSEPPATAAPSPQLAQTRQRKSGPDPVHNRELIQQLYEENPDSSVKQLRTAYKDKTGVEVGDTWVRTHRVRPRS
jgi:hypothetical protein